MQQRHTTETLTGKIRPRTQTRLLLPDYIVTQVQVRETGYHVTVRGKKIEVDNMYWRDATEDELESSLLTPLLL